MNIDCVSLALTASWRQERLLLVRATDAMRLCGGDGNRWLPWPLACHHIEALRLREMVWVRRFVAQARLTSVPLTALDDDKLFSLLHTLVREGVLVVLREGEGEAKGQGDSAKEQRRLIRDIAARTRRLSYAGREYKLVADVDLGRMPQRDSYEVVRRDDAVQVLGGLGTQQGSSELSALLNQAQAKLTRDWRPPLEPDGLILLRKIITVTAHANDQPAMTPSQLKQLLLTNIEIELRDMEGDPVSGEAWEVVLPDGSKRSGQLDKKGYALIDGIPAGTCRVTFPRLDEEAWSRCA